MTTGIGAPTPDPDPDPGGQPPRVPTGQWALGDRSPLNANEAWKAEEGGLAVRQRVLDRYAREGFAGIPAVDRAGRLRWWGLHTQRRPGIHGGRTAGLSAAELDDEFFMLRVRIDGGAVSLDQLRVLADIATRYARGSADITDRQNVQFHWIRIEDVPAIWAALESVGLRTTEAGGDAPRAILGSPVAGIAADEIVDGTPAIEEITRRYVGDPDLANLPRKFKTAISGSPHQDVAHEINDVAFVGVWHPEHGPGFDLWVGGGLSTAPMLARRLGAWVPLAEVVEVWHGVVAVFRDYGYRRLRSRARLKFLVADWGPAKFREVLEREYLRRPLLDGPPPPAPPGRRDHIGVHRQRDGRCYVGVAPIAGRVGGDILPNLVRAVQRAGSTRLRFTPEQKVLVLDVEDAKVPALLDDLAAIGLPGWPSAFRRGVMACTGIQFCKLAIVETKATAATLVAELERRFADVADLAGVAGRPGSDLQPISIRLNGCPNSCVRAQTADVGLRGIQLPDPADPTGPTVEGFQVQLGGLAPDGGAGRRLRGLRTSGADLPDYLDRVLRRWLSQRAGAETFSAWVRRAEEADLR